jgi:excisionase family DNA binding protein
MATLRNRKQRPLTVAPTEADSRLAQESSRRLAPYLKERGNLRMQIVSKSGRLEEALMIPSSVFRVLFDMLTAMAEGKAVTLISTEAELTSQQIANLLNVSRPFVVGLMDKGEIPHHKVGKHRRVRLGDLMAYKEQVTVRQQKALEDLAAEAQELNMGY